MIKATQLDAYTLFHRGSVALAKVENNGFRIDTAYLQNAIKQVSQDIIDLERQLTEDKVWKIWKKNYPEANLTSRPQLADILFNKMKMPCKMWTGGGKGKPKPSTEDKHLKEINHPFVAKYLEKAKLDKILNTYLLGIAREVDANGYLHPCLNIASGGGGDDDKGGAHSYRSCIAEGTLIEVVRDISKDPKGIPIEKIKAGDFVYCYDNNLNLTIRKVLWAGKTGTKEVIRLHWRARGKRGYLDVTPDHLIRMVDGSYVKAKDVRKQKSVEWKVPIGHVLAMGRRTSHLYQTGQTETILDHRLVYKELIGSLQDHQVVHHKDKNHYNNIPSNLEALTKGQHSKHHAEEGDSFTDEGRRKSQEVRRQKIKEGLITFKKGEENHLWIPYSKFQLLRLIAKNQGRLTYMGHDFESIKNKMQLVGIDMKVVRDRFDRSFKYISLGRLKRAFTRGKVRDVVLAFGVNYSKAKRILEDRGFNYDPVGPNRNPNGRRGGKVNNHFIYKIEKIKKVVDVYDIEVEDYHNFIANEICVHNSSSLPNLQNIPVRNKKVSQLVRGCFIPRPGRRILEVDYGGIEVKISSCYNLDPVLIEYINDPSKDMHRDMAAQCYMLDFTGWEKSDYKDLRYSAKNRFVFPQFYGSVWYQCAPTLWSIVDTTKIKGGLLLKDHLASKGITSLGECDPNQKPRPGTYAYHIWKVEQDFWGNRFSVYSEWKKRWWDSYLKKGYFDLLTGFRVEGVYRKNVVINLPVQGAAFHCLLWSLIKVQDYLDKKKMKSLIVNEIHDSIILDIVEEEMDELLPAIKKIMTEKIRKSWQWLNVPLEVEFELCPKDQSWHTKEVIKV